MSLLSYVINWDELALSLATDVSVSVEDIGGAIDSNLPEVIDLLKQIRDILYQMGAKYRNYNQKIEGFYLKTTETLKTIDWTNEENCYLTGVTCSHSHVEAVDDFFMLSLIKLDEETGEEAIELIFDKVYLKDALQHKYFNKYFPVPAGVIVRITHNNPSSLDKHVWYDLEYLEFFGLREDEEWEDIPIYEPEEPVKPITIMVKHLLLGDKASKDDDIAHTSITLDGVTLGTGDKFIDYHIQVNIGDIIELHQDMYYDSITGLSDYEFVEWRNQIGVLIISPIEVIAGLTELIAVFKRTEVEEEIPEEPATMNLNIHHKVIPDDLPLSTILGSTSVAQKYVIIGSKLDAKATDVYSCEVELAEDVKLRAIPKEDYEFKHWEYEDSSIISGTSSIDGKTSILEFIPQDGLTDLYAIFEEIIVEPEPDPNAHELIIKYKINDISDTKIGRSAIWQSGNNILSGHDVHGGDTDKVTIVKGLDYDLTFIADKPTISLVRLEANDNLQLNIMSSIDTVDEETQIKSYIKYIEYNPDITTITAIFEDEKEESKLPVNIPVRHVLLGEKVSENDGVGYTLITLDGALLGSGDRLIDYVITVNIGDSIYLQQDVYYDTLTGLSDYEFIEWKDQDGKLNTSTVEVTSNLSELICVFKRKDMDIPIESEDPVDPPEQLSYFCDNSIIASSIDTDYFNWNQLSIDYMVHQEGYNITGEFWNDRNLLLDFFYNLPETPDSYNDYRKNKITMNDFHKFLFKSLHDSRLGTLIINQNWQQFKAWADINLSCLTDLQKGSLFYTVKSKIITNLFPTAEGFIAGKVPDVICKYLSRLPYIVVDWIDYNDVKEEAQGSNSVTGAYAVDLFTSQYPTLLDAFASYVNMEPQTLGFSTQSLSASNPSDYINVAGNFWGASVPSSIVDWTSYITSEFASGDTEIHKGLVATETAVHELGHCVDYYYTKNLGRFLTESNEWYNIGDWKRNPNYENDPENEPEWIYLVKTRHANQTGGMPKTDGNKEAPVSDYGCSQPMEDFAEAFNIYIINPNLLRDKYPLRFAYMEKYVKPLL